MEYNSVVYTVISALHDLMTCLPPALYSSPSSASRNLICPPSSIRLLHSLEHSH